MSKKRRKKKIRQEKARKPGPEKAATEAAPEKKRYRRRVKPVLLYSVLLIVALAAFFFLHFLKPEINIKKDGPLNVLLVTLDTTRADAIGLYSGKNDVSPNIDELGRSSVVFRECYSPVPLTLPAHCSLFTGRYPMAHNVRNNGTYFLDDNELTLAEVFKKNGYQTAAVVSSFTVFSKFGLSQGFDHYDEDFDSGQAILNFEAEIPANSVYDKFRRWFDSRSGQDFFCWVHFYDPHAPYVGHGDTAGQGGASPWNRYEGEVTFVDAYVGKMIEALKAEALYENTVIVIAGDHGEAFGEHKEQGHGIFCYEESLRVPLIIHNPRLFRNPKLVTERVRLVDVMPTLLELFGLQIPAEIQGQSFLKLIENKAERQKRMVYFESLFGKEESNWAPLTGIIDSGYKYISLPEPELYDLRDDEKETRNLVGSQMAVAQAMDKKLEQFIRSHAATRSPTRRTLSQSDAEMLRTLGYVSGFSGKAKQMMDPKRAMDIYLEVAEIKELIRQKNYGRADSLLAAVLARNPEVDLPDIYEISYQVQEHKGEVKGAIETLQKAIGLFPENEAFKVFLGMTYIESGDLTTAEGYCRQLLDANSKMTAAHILLGDAQDRLNKVEPALLSYENALALEPQNGMIKVKVAGMLAKKGELSRAQAILEELESPRNIVQTPEYLEALSNLALQVLSAGDGERAIALYRKATAINPENPDAWLNLGSAYLRQKRYDLALENFEKALTLNKKIALAYSNIGVVYMTRFSEENDPALADRALDYFNRAIALQPDLATAYNGRGWTLSALNRMPQALRDFERSIELDPDSKDAYINISLALYHLGRYADALRYLDVVKGKFYERMSLRDREDIERLYAQLKALK